MPAGYGATARRPPELRRATARRLRRRRSRRRRAARPAAHPRVGPSAESRPRAPSETSVSAGVVTLRGTVAEKLETAAGVTAGPADARPKCANGCARDNIALSRRAPPVAGRCPADEPPRRLTPAPGR